MTVSRHVTYFLQLPAKIAQLKSPVSSCAVFFIMRTTGAPSEEQLGKKDIPVQQRAV